MKEWMTLATALVLLMFSNQAIAQTEQSKTCVIMGKEQAVSKDTTCPPDILKELQTLRIEKKIVKMTASGEPELDAEGKPMMETKLDTFTAMAKLLVDTKIADTMSKGGAYTVWALDDETLSKAPPELLQKQSGEEDSAATKRLYLLVAKHVLPKVNTRQSIGNSNGSWVTVGGQELRYNFLGQNVVIDERVNASLGQKVKQFDIVASNGVIHWVDGLLDN